jgi:hypothetical protein
MRSQKRFSNIGFTKRVDHDAGSHRGAKAMPEPAECVECGAVWADRRWTAASLVRESGRHHVRPPRPVLCPACKQRFAGEPRGFVTVEGEYAAGHRLDIERLVTHEVAHAQEDNPLAQVLEMQWGADRLEISTTTEHLAQRIGTALRKAHGGKVSFDFSHENKLARVTWHRD